MIRKLACWWFGCWPDFESPGADHAQGVVPCARCGAPDTTYEARIGDSRSHRAAQFISYWLLRRWRRRPHPDDLPF